MNEAELVRAVVAGDKRAGDELVHRYRRVVRMLVWRCAKRDRHLVDDLEQDAWLSIFRTLDRYDPAISSLSTWFGVVAKSAVLAHNVRTRLERERATVPLERTREDADGERYPGVLELEPSKVPTPLELIEEAEERCAVEGARSCLPAKQRMVVDLYFAGVEPGEIRRRLACTRENVNYLLHRAASKIRAVLPFLQRSDAFTFQRVLPVELPN